MGKDEFINIILIVFVIFIVFKLFQMLRASKNNQRINKYTVKTLKQDKSSLGEMFSNTYYNFRKYFVKIISNFSIVKALSTKYEKYIHADNNKKTSAYEIIANKITLSCVFAGIYIITSIYKNNFDLLYLLFYMIIGFYVYNVYLIIYEKRRNTLIENDLLKSIIIMNNAFKSGYNITQAITMVTKDLTGPISEEFKKINIDLKYGLELKDVFDRFYERVKVKDARYITSSLSMLNLTGGNLVPIFSSIEKSFTNKKRLKDELNSLTSSSKLVYYFLLVMPVVLSLFLFILNPDYFKPLYSTIFGYVVFSLIIVLYISYIFIVKRIMKVDL